MGNYICLFWKKVVFKTLKNPEKFPSLHNKALEILCHEEFKILFNHSVSEEFLYVYNSGLLGIDELNEIRLNGLK